MDYRRKYTLYGELGFPQPIRTYFDHISHEFTYSSMEDKLLDIGYLLWNGYDVRSDIHSAYGDDHPSVSVQDVQQTLYVLLAGLWGGKADSVKKMFRFKSMDALIDELFTAILRYYHSTADHDKPHYLKDPIEMTESELKASNPWIEVANLCRGNSFLWSECDNLVCSDDKDMIDNFNNTAKEEYQYKLNVPAFPWYGNPLKAKVIVLSLNPGYVEREAKAAKLFKIMPQGLVEGYATQLRSMLTFDCRSFFPDNHAPQGVSARDLAEMHQTYYWTDRLIPAFVTEETGLSFEQVCDRFAVIQYVGYSSVKYKAFKKGQTLPTQNYTKQLIQFILHNRKDTVFLVPRNVNTWKGFLGNMWTSYEDRFIVTGDYLGQRFTKNILGKENFAKVIEAFKS